MAKNSGNIRQVAREDIAGYNTFPRKAVRFMKEFASGKYNQDYSFFDTTSGGSLLVEQNRPIDANEVNAATFLARSGETVKMTTEGDGIYILASYGGSEYYGDGFITIDTFKGKFEDYSYEQRTVDPQKFPFRLSVKSAINHAHRKGAKIALIYDRSWKISQSEIRKGMRDFRKAIVKKKKQYVEQVWIINGIGQVSKWKIKNDTV